MLFLFLMILNVFLLFFAGNDDDDELEVEGIRRQLDKGLERAE